MVAKARKIDNAIIIGPVPEGGVLLRDISWELYESLLCETEEQHIRMTYDRGYLEIVPALLHGISWRLYEELLRATDEQHVRMTYDRGDLEIMAPLQIHERFKCNISRCISILAMERNLNVCQGGSTTFKREDLAKGLEPDDCFWIANEPKVRDKEILDLTVDPPPDLAIEIDIRNSSLNKHGIYAVLRVPEIWRYNGQELGIYWLNKSGTYDLKKSSRAFPFLPMKEFQKFIRKPAGIPATEWDKSFQKWVRNGFK